MLKKGISVLLYESDDSFIERPNSLEHYDKFKKIFTNLMQRDISEQEFNDLMQYTQFHKQHDSSNIKRNLNKKHNLKHCDIVEKHKNSHTFLKKVDSKNESDLFQNSSCNKHHSIKHHDIDKDLLYLRKKRQSYLYAYMFITMNICIKNINIRIKEKKYLKKKKIINLEDESTEAFKKRTYVLQNNEHFQEDKKSPYSDASSQEHNYLMENLEFDELGEFDFESNLK
ncbi:hypothetical protein MKS88_000795 [Plasmodium brasilianum]|uniref:Uncharacterized protein n=1 Tax=Plasmodium brasilianum TaxID=5824 RepID=A0ACB9YGG3_PLABR|nr:hypothetical protein MKS88_000795 [Plasmodium brasilianum]